eukprot:COSAG01_NODE_2862_length_6958_cov_21.483015_7_plen_284_part_00
MAEQASHEPTVVSEASSKELDSRPLDSEGVSDTAIGLGGCVAHALAALGVFSSVDAAKAALDREGATELAQRLETHGSTYDTTKVYTPGDNWCSVVIKTAVVAAGFDFQKIDLGSICLRDALKSGTYLIDGTQNQHWQRGRHIFTNDPTCTGPGPEERPQDWRHALGVKDGQVLEQNDDTFSTKWLHLNEDNSVDVSKAYMRNILKVYHISKRAQPKPGARSASAVITEAPLTKSRGKRGKAAGRKDKQKAKKARTNHTIDQAGVTAAGQALRPKKVTTAASA